MMMKKVNGVWTLSLSTLFFMLLTLTASLRPHHFVYNGNIGAGYNKIEYSRQILHLEDARKGEEVLGMELYPTGSRLPDCSHACGPCSPCKRVMVSFKCSIAESCPIVYRCMCKGKYYHVPSN